MSLPSVIRIAPVSCGSASQTGDWKIDPSKAVMEAWLKDPVLKDIQAVHAHNIEEAMGAIQKSTLIKILTGVEQPDRGTITIDQQMTSIRSPQHAQELGITTVYQEVNLCPQLTIAENILIGRESMTWGSINWKAINACASQILQRLDKICPSARS